MASRRGSIARRRSMRCCTTTREPIRGSRSTPRTACIAKPAISRIRHRTSSGRLPKAAAGLTTRTCEGERAPRLAADGFARHVSPMRAPGFLIVGLASVLLCGCASVGMGPSKSVQTTLESDGEASSYGQYLAGQAAVNHADSASAETYFAKAAGMDPEDRPLLATRAFTDRKST